MATLDRSLFLDGLLLYPKKNRCYPEVELANAVCHPGCLT